MNDTDRLIIINEMGSPLNIDKDEINIFKEMGYQLDENHKKLNMEEIVLLDLAIKKKENFTQITAHTYCGIPDDKNLRWDRHYFLYYTKSSDSLLNILKDFVAKADKEIHRCQKEIIENEESHFVFRDIKRVLSKEIPGCDESIVNEAFQCLKKRPVKLVAQSIEKAMPFIINLDKKSQYLTYIINNVDRFSEESNVNIIIDKNIYNEVKLLNSGETNNNNVLTPSSIPPPVNKLPIKMESRDFRRVLSIVLGVAILIWINYGLNYIIKIIPFPLPPYVLLFIFAIVFVLASVFYEKRGVLYPWFLLGGVVTSACFVFMITAIIGGYISEIGFTGLSTITVLYSLYIWPIFRTFPRHPPRLRYHVFFSVAIVLILFIGYWMSATSSTNSIENSKSTLALTPKTTATTSQTPVVTPAVSPIPVVASASDQKSITNSIGMEFVLIPAGEFDMGSPSDETGRYDNVGPVHRVKISNAFYLGKYEVTQKQWRDVMGSRPSYFKGDNLPVETVSWNDVQDFIKKLNEKEGGDKYRLPTEAEWEYTARAGTTTRYFFGDDESKLGEYAWYNSNSGSKTHDVGQKKPNPWGLYDMQGNVWEWVQDYWHDNYKGAPSDGSSWEGGSNRIVRGGDWKNLDGICRSAFRCSEVPDLRSYILGFRLLRIS